MSRTSGMVVVVSLVVACGGSQSAASGDWSFVETRTQGPLKNHYFVGQRTVFDQVKRVTLRVKTTGTDEVPDPAKGADTGTFYVYFQCEAGLATGRMPALPDHQAKVEPLILQKQPRYWQPYAQLRTLGHDDAVSPGVIAAACR